MNEQNMQSGQISPNDQARYDATTAPAPGAMPTMPAAAAGPTGGAKAGYFALGFFLGLIGVLVSWLMTKDKDPLTKSAVLKFSMICFGALAVLCILGGVATFGMLAMVYL